VTIQYWDIVKYCNSNKVPGLAKEPVSFFTYQSDTNNSLTLTPSCHELFCGNCDRLFCFQKSQRSIGPALTAVSFSSCRWIRQWSIFFPFFPLFFLLYWFDVQWALCSQLDLLEEV
jgi:hypothetical protein